MIVASLAPRSASRTASDATKRTSEVEQVAADEGGPVAGQGDPGDVLHDEQRPRALGDQLADLRQPADQIGLQDRGGLGDQEQDGRGGQRPIGLVLPVLAARFISHGGLHVSLVGRSWSDAGHYCSQATPSWSRSLPEFALYSAVL